MTKNKIEQYTLDEFYGLNKDIVEFKTIGKGPDSIVIYYCADEDSYYARGYFGYMRYDVESVIKLPVNNSKELNEWIENVSKAF